MTSLPTILVIGPTPPPHNGMSVATSNLLKSSLCEQFDLLLLDTADRRGLTNVGRLDWRNVTLAMRHGIEFLRLITAKRPRVIYVSIAQNVLGYLRDCLFLIPARLAGCKVVVHLHGGGFRVFYDGSPTLLRSLIRWTLHDVRRVIVLGERFHSIFSDLVDEARIVTVPNGVADHVSHDVQARNRDDACLQVTYLGTLMKSKGFLDLLRAAPLVIARCPETRFILAGEMCDLEDQFEADKIIDSHCLSGVVELPGVVTGEDKARLFLKADVFVFPTRYPYEGQPFVILEAMAGGLPVITTDRGAITETVIEHVNGFIVREGDPEAIAEKIVLLLQNGDLRRQMGQASRERFLMHYTVERWVHDMARVFQNVLEED